MSRARAAPARLPSATTRTKTRSARNWSIAALFHLAQESVRGVRLCAPGPGFLESAHRRAGLPNFESCSASVPTLTQENHLENRDPLRPGPCRARIDCRYVSAKTAALDAAGAARLDAYRHAPDAAGELIYRGAVFDATRAACICVVQLRAACRPHAKGQSAAHITHAPNGDVVIVEEATFGPGYALQRFDATNRQLGYSGSVDAQQRRAPPRLSPATGWRGHDGHRRRERPGRQRTVLHGFILQHWDALARGDRLPVRMIVMAKTQTYGFDIRRADTKAGRTSFSITPSDWLVRLALKPLTVTFDSATRNVVRYEGRVPPMRGVDGKLKALDARVDYTMAAAAYR